MKATGIEKQVIKDIKERQKLGINKYQTTVADNPLSLREWLNHQYEELLDAAIYAKRAIAEIDNEKLVPFISGTVEQFDNIKPEFYIQTRKEHRPDDCLGCCIYNDDDAGCKAINKYMGTHCGNDGIIFKLKEVKR